MKYFSRLVLIFILSLAFVSCGKKGTAYNRNIMANYSIVAAQEYQISALVLQAALALQMQTHPLTLRLACLLRLSFRMIQV
ncbi:MAG: hypothetical protein J6X11_13510 [Treponema sp.]|nr:hypothetical protein [Treponema sp.]